MQLLDPKQMPPIPDTFRCPICGEKLFFEFSCTDEPDIDSKEWWPWWRHHYNMPYVDWLPLEIRILAWIKKNYRFAGLGESIMESARCPK